MSASTFQIRYRPDSALGQRFPTTRYPWRGCGYPTRDKAEELMRACINSESMEIVEVKE